LLHGITCFGSIYCRDTAGSFANILGGDPWYNASVHGNNEFLSEGAYITSKL
jgi:phospholipid-binding lipoprotein MlaA